ncbi:MAG: hypothetical protein U0894_01645 [Pirellulales bacterium]
MFSPRIQNLLLAALLGLVATGCAGKGHSGLSSTHSSEVYDTSRFRAGSNRPPVAKTPSKNTSAKPAEGTSPEMAEVIDSDQAKRPTGEDPSSHVIIRGQAPATQPTTSPYGAAPNYYTQPQPGYTQPNYSQPNYSQPAGNYAAPCTGYTQPAAQPNYGAPGANYAINAQPQQQTAYQGPGALPPAPPSDAYGGLPGDPLIPTPSLEEMTPQQARQSWLIWMFSSVKKLPGCLMFGVTVNSNNGLTGQVTIDERNFDITRLPRGFNDPGAFRGSWRVPLRSPTWQPITAATWLASPNPIYSTQTSPQHRSRSLFRPRLFRLF